jgi:hypothetical protein
VVAPLMPSSRKIFAQPYSNALPLASSSGAVLLPFLLALLFEFFPAGFFLVVRLSGLLLLGLAKRGNINHVLWPCRG